MREPSITQVRSSRSGSGGLVCQSHPSDGGCFSEIGTANAKTALVRKMSSPQAPMVPMNVLTRGLGACHPSSGIVAMQQWRCSRVPGAAWHSWQRLYPSNDFNSAFLTCGHCPPEISEIGKSLPTFVLPIRSSRMPATTSIRSTLLALVLRLCVTCGQHQHSQNR